MNHPRGSNHPGQPASAANVRNGHNGHVPEIGEIDPGDYAAATTVFRLAHGRIVSPNSRRDLGQKEGWSALAEFVENSRGDPPGPARLKRIAQYLENVTSRHPELTRRFRAAIDQVLNDFGDDGPDDESSDEPSAFSLGLIDSEAFFAETYRLEWLVKGILVKDQLAVFGGPQKTLKTSILIDLVVSLGTGSPFLGKFEVPEPLPVALISGESGRYVIQQNAREICLTRGVSYSTDRNINWGFTLPQITNDAHLSELSRAIKSNGLKCICLDPLYLSILAGNSGIDPKNMFEMGPILAKIAEMCLNEGCTPILAHHFVKHREDPFGPPELGELAYSGVGQSMRQWMLIARRERFDAENGIHRLHFHFGGSAGHCGEYALDIETGKLDEDFKGRKWLVTVASPSEHVTTCQERKRDDQARKAVEGEETRSVARDAVERERMAKAVAVFRKASEFRHTVGSFRAATGWNYVNSNRILHLLLQDGYVTEVKQTVTIGNGATRTFPGYELVPSERGGL